MIIQTSPQYFNIPISQFKEISIIRSICQFKEADIINITTNLFRTQFKITKEWTSLSKNTAKFKELIDQCKRLQFIIKINPFNILIGIKISRYRCIIHLSIMFQFSMNLNIRKNRSKINLLYMISPVNILLKIQIKVSKKW